MSRNTLKEPEHTEEASRQPEKKVRSSKSARKLIRFMNVFGFFNKDQVVKLMPFILFLTLLIVFYIANSYYAERTIRNIDKVKKEIRENRAEFISVRSEMMFRSNQSQIAKAVVPLELKEATEPPKKIIVNQSPKDNKE